MRTITSLGVRLALCLALITWAGNIDCQAQSTDRYAEINHSLAKTHCQDYLDQGNAAYNKKDYKSALDYYKRAREENNRYNGEFYSQSALEKKIDDCNYAIGHGETRQEHKENRDDGLANLIVGAIFGSKTSSSNSSSNSSSSSSSSSKSDANTLNEVSYHGLTYTTLAANKGTHILSITRTATETIIQMEYINTHNDTRYYSIGRDTYIKDRDSSTKFLIESADKIPYKSSKDYRVASGESATFTLHFGALPASCTSFDLVEPGDSEWKFYSIPVTNEK